MLHGKQKQIVVLRESTFLQCSKIKNLKDIVIDSWLFEIGIEEFEMEKFKTKDFTIYEFGI